VNTGSRMVEIRGVDIRTKGANANAIIIGDTSSVQHMSHVIMRRSAAATAEACAIVVEDDGEKNYFVTSEIADNTVCRETGSAGWSAPLCDDDVFYSAPTNPFVNDTTGPFGAQTFPWGDVTHNNNDGATDWNRQKQWGGTCE
jgi:hypothetical protein